MKGSEYVAARMALTFLAAGAAVGVVGVTATVAAPWVATVLSAAMPVELAPLGGLAVGLSVVVVTAVLMRRVLSYVLAWFERWVVDHGGIEDGD